MIAAIGVISTILDLLTKGLPVVEQLYSAVGIVRQASFEGRDVTSQELDALDALRDQAVAKFDADVAAVQGS